MSKEYVAIDMHPDSPAPYIYFMEDGELYYFVEDFPNKVRLSHYLYEELLEEYNGKGHWVTNLKEVNKYMMTRELLK